eukprot:365326-Chlamydomonas_euryale.AAC.7
MGAPRRGAARPPLLLPPPLLLLLALLLLIVLALAGAQGLQGAGRGRDGMHGAIPRSGARARVPCTVKNVSSSRTAEAAFPGLLLSIEGAKNRGAVCGCAALHAVHRNGP